MQITGRKSLRKLFVPTLLIWVDVFGWSGNDKRPWSRGVKKLSEFGNSSLQGYETFQNTCFIVFRCNQRGADDLWPISADFFEPSISGSLSFSEVGAFPWKMRRYNAPTNFCGRCSKGKQVQPVAPPDRPKMITFSQGFPAIANDALRRGEPPSFWDQAR